MAIINRFSPPGNADDLTDENKTYWSDALSKSFASSKTGDSSENDGPRTQFFNPTTDDVPGGLVEQVITWTAFPRQVSLSSAGDQQRWRKADSSRTLQDEYCEWSVHRSNDGRILWIDFTSEGPEYWEILAERQPDTLLALYQKYISPEVERDDVFPTNDKYSRTNRWNNSTTNGAMHLIQAANTLGAEIELAAGASIVRRRGGALLTQEQDLINCSQYGAPKRHSDPHIGAEVNKFAREGRLVSLSDPVGLFIQGCDFSGFEMPTTNVSADQCWKVQRGAQDRALRVRFAPPDGETFTVSDLTIDGVPIGYGGQIADKISIGLAAWASSDTAHLRIVDGCRSAGAALLAAGMGSRSDVASRRAR